MKINDLFDIIDQCQTHKTEDYVFLNIVSKDIVYFNDSIYSVDELDNILQEYDDDTDWIPVKVESFERDMYQEFFDLQEGHLKEKLYLVFFSRGGYSKAKTVMYEAGIIDDFYRFRNQYQRKIVFQWCEEHQISFED